MAIRLLLIALWANLAFAQTTLHVGQNCKTVLAPQDKSSFDKLMDSLAPAGSMVSLYALVEENKPLAIMAATASAATALYNYFQEHPTVEICSPPPSFNTLGHQVTLIGSAAALQPLTSPSSTGNSSLGSLNSEYRKLITPQKTEPNLLGQTSQQTAVLATPFNFQDRQYTGDTAKIRGTVTDLLGHPLAMGTVQVTPLDQSGSWVRALTWLDGTFEIAVDPGKYFVYAHVDGYREYTTTVVKTRFLDPPLRIQLLLAPPVAPNTNFR